MDCRYSEKNPWIQTLIVLSKILNSKGQHRVTRSCAFAVPKICCLLILRIAHY